MGIIADDLTGATDSSSHFARKGFSTIVFLTPHVPLTADVIVINTDSRADDTRTARKKVKKAVGSLLGRTIYKKIDSSLRGNIGVELKEIKKELAAEKVIIAPAFPAVGRTTIEGRVLVDGIPVNQTQFADDPVSPVKESHIPTLLARSIEEPIGSITIEDINLGPEALYQKFIGSAQDILVCDVTEQSHLACIVQAASLTQEHWLLCGSGGLARELSPMITHVPSRTETPPSTPSYGAALVIAGTRSHKMASQLIKAKEEIGLPILKLPVEVMKQEHTSSIMAQVMEKEAADLITQGKSLAITSVFSEFIPDLQRTVANTLAETAIAILASNKYTGVFLSGGDIATEICRRLSVSAIIVLGEIEPGVPAGELIGGEIGGMRVVTKAGGFGSESALVKTISYLEKGNNYE